MSNLYETVEELASEMLANPNAEIIAYGRMLKVALKAAGKGNSEPAKDPMAYLPPEVVNRIMIDKARAEMAPKALSKEDGEGDRSVLVMDGPFKDEYATIQSRMPLDSYTHVGNCVYQLKSDGLYLKK